MSAETTHGHDPVKDFTLERFGGTSKVMQIAAGLAVLGLGATAAGAMKDPTMSLVGYLIGFLFCLGIALGALVLMMAFHVAHGRWITVLRRAIETMASTLPLFAVLFIPIALGARKLYLWADPPKTLNAEQLHQLHHKHSWLNMPGFYARSALYLLIFIGISQLFWKWSTSQDETAAAANTQKARWLSAGGLPVLGMALSFAAFDWLLSINPFFSSTMFGVYYFANGFLAAVCILTIASRMGLGQKDTHSDHLSPSHWHNLGKLMLAFTAFWAYIGFSQYMLIWIANLPEEIHWYISRSQGPWEKIWWLLIVGHFAVPFFALLSRGLKRMPSRLAALAGFILVFCWIDVWWLVTPEFSATPFLPWQAITGTLGVGGACIAFALFRIKGRYAIPVGDPYLEDSLRYTQP